MGSLRLLTDRAGRIRLWLHTGRALPPRQAAAWLIRRLRGPRPFHFDEERPVARSPEWQALAVAWQSVEAKRNAPALEQAELACDSRFRFLNHERHLPSIDWSADYESPLWTYHLHYFDYALDLARAWRRTGEQRFGDRYVELWTSWLDAAAGGNARIKPYPTSVRCLNALSSLWLVEDRLPSGTADRLLRATDAQLDWLGGNLEYGLRANHLQKNLTALAWGSIALAGSTADRERYLGELWREFGEQVLPDGGHFERSPMYQTTALDDFLRTLLLCQVAEVAVPTYVPGRIAAMTRALQCLSRPDDTLHLFNDAANGSRPGRNEVVTLARHVLDGSFREPEGIFTLADTGYFGRIEPSTGHRLIIDAGPLGPSYQPGHAHCDMLSFELDVEGRPVIVDAGLHGYEGDPYREYVRSTRAHNTVAINGRDQHEMWGSFRVARRGEIIDVAAEANADGGFEFSGVCRHYHDRRAVHRRSMASSDHGLTVIDRVDGDQSDSLSSWLHLHPDFRLERSGHGFTAVAHDSAGFSLDIELFGVDETLVWRGERNPEQGWYCPEFGIARPAWTIELRVHENAGRAFGYRICLA